MARRTPFPFREHHDDLLYEAGLNEMIESWITEYEDALLVEYKSGDVDVASFHEGLRTAYEAVLVGVLGIDPAVMDAYWGRGPRPEPEIFDLPHPPSSPLITYEQVTEWTGRRLTNGQWDALDDAIPNSSIPEAISVIVDNLKEN